jgi:hypothetical protein
MLSGIEQHPLVHLIDWKRVQLGASGLVNHMPAWMQRTANRDQRTSTAWDRDILNDRCAARRAEHLSRPRSGALGEGRFEERGV